MENRGIHVNRLSFIRGFILIQILAALTGIPAALAQGDDCNDPIPFRMNTQIEGNNCDPCQDQFTPVCQGNDSRDVF